MTQAHRYQRALRYALTIVLTLGMTLTAPPPAHAETYVDIPDKALLAAANAELSQRLGTTRSATAPVSDKDAAKVIELHIGFNDDTVPLAKDLTGIDAFSNLYLLSVYDSELSDLRPLAHITSLRHLYLTGPITDLSPLKNLTRLDTLELTSRGATLPKKSTGTTVHNPVRAINGSVIPISTASSGVDTGKLPKTYRLTTPGTKFFNWSATVTAGTVITTFQGTFTQKATGKATASDKAPKIATAARNGTTNSTKTIVLPDTELQQGLYPGILSLTPGNFAQPGSLETSQTASGDLVVYRNGHEKLTVTTYNPATGKQRGKTKAISLKGWPVWGGIYDAPDGFHYVAVGRDNPHEKDNRTVIQIRKYNKTWALKGTATVSGGASHTFKGIYEPFEAGELDMTLAPGNRLVVHFPRTMYLHDDGLHHQSNFTIEVNTQTMQARTFEELAADEYSHEYSYVSHSFNQFVLMRDGDLITIDHGDAFPRSVVMDVAANYPSTRNTVRYELLPIGGGTGNNYTGLRITDVVSGPQGIVILGVSQPDPSDDASFDGTDYTTVKQTSANAFAITVNPKNGEHTFRWLSQFPAAAGATIYGPRATKIGADQFAVLYGIDTSTDRYSFAARTEFKALSRYALMDSAGTITAQRTLPGSLLVASATPVLIGKKLFSVMNQGPVQLGERGNGDKYPDRYAIMEINIANPAKPTFTPATSPTAAPVIPETCQPFPDVNAYNVHCRNIGWLKSTKITLPADGKYHAKQAVTRGQMALFLYRLTNPGKASPKCTTKPFDDVSKSNTFCGAIGWAAANGVTSGVVGTHNFNPDGKVTRGQMSAFLKRVGTTTATASCTAAPFTDVSKTHLFCGTIAWLDAHGITSGVGDGTAYAPDRVVNRDQMASFLHRIYDYRATHPGSAPRFSR